MTLPVGSISQFLMLDMVPMLSITLAALSCALLGNFLVLRRQSLMGDAISHAVLPGLVAAVLLTSSLSPWAMFLGAGAAAISTALLIELVKRLGRVEPGAAMGVVFSVLFALGVLLLERAPGLENVDLDPNCVLYGQPEYLFWLRAPDTLAGLASPAAWSTAPTALFSLAVVFVGVVLFVTVLFKELRIASFDPALATTQGIHAGAIHVALMLAVAAATVASFEAVGSILVIAMLITPASSARLLTDRLSTQLWLSAIIAASTAVGGYTVAANAERLFGLSNSLNAAGTITVCSALVFGVVVLVSPSQGVIARSVRHRRLSRKVAVEDLLGRLFRAREQKPAQPGVTIERLSEESRGGSGIEPALKESRRRGFITIRGQEIALTETGLARAAQVIQRHRDWQGYLVDEAGLRPDHAHDQAHQLEHLPPEPRLTSGGEKDPSSSTPDGPLVDP